MGAFDDLIPAHQGGAFSDLVPQVGGQNEVLSQDAFTAGTRGVGQGLTLGFGDELMAGFAAPFRALGRSVIGGDEGKSIGDRLADAYMAELTNLRSLNAQSAEDHPVAFGAGEVAGGVMGAGKAAQGGLTLMNLAKPTIPRMAGAAVVEGGLYGGAYGFGTGEGAEQRLSQAGQGAALGGVTAGALGVAGGLAAKYAANKAVKTTQDLEAFKNAAYANAEQAGQGSVPKQFRDLFADGLEKQMRKIGVTRGQTPQTDGALETLVNNFKGGDDLPLDHVDLLRQNLLDAAMSESKAERRMAGIAINKLDRFIDLLPGGPLWKDARAAYKIFRKAKTIDKLIEKAALKVDQQTSTGWDNALQIEFRNFSRNDRLMRGFSKAEQEAIKAVAKDGVGIRFLRKVGKLSPTSGFLPLVGNLAAFSTGNPWLMSGAVFGELSKNIVTLSRRGRAKAALKLMQNAGKSPQVKRLGVEARQALAGGVAAGAEQTQSLTGDILAYQ